jgi:hypothetical protein
MKAVGYDGGAGFVFAIGSLRLAVVDGGPFHA